MSIPAILLLAVGLAADAAAVSASRGMMVARLRAVHFVAVALFFGVAQAVMPLIGWALGAQIGDRVKAWDHWIAFVLLGGIGAKMLWESRRGDDDEAAPVNPFGLRIMIVLAIATSIDALAVGVTLPMMHAPLVATIVTIGVVTAALSMLGLWAGRRFGALLGTRMTVAGGLILIGLGTKILIEHLFAS